MAKQHHQGRHLRLRHRHREPRPLHLGLPQPALAERRQHLRGRSQARGASPSPPRSRSPSSGKRFRTSTRSPRPRTPTAATRSSRARLGMWIAGSWNFTGLREAKVDFVAVPVPRLFKQPVVWAMPHQYTFPKPKGAADRARRDAAWAHVRWMTDHVAEWTLKAGQVSASRKSHTDPRITGDPVLRALLAPGAQLAGRPAHAQVGRGRERDPSGDRGGLHRAEAGQGRDGGSGAPDQRAAGLARVAPTTRVAYAFLAPGLLLFAVFRLYPLLEGLRLSFTNARLGRATEQWIGLANYTRLLEDDSLPREPLEHRVLHGGQHAPDPGGAAGPGPGAQPRRACGPCSAASSSSRSRSRSSRSASPGSGSSIPSSAPSTTTCGALGVPARSWLADPQTAMWAIILTTVWWVTGYYLVIYLAGLQDIPRDLYEAAALDGASGWRSFWAITLPLLRPVLLFVVVTHVIGSFQLFGQVFVLTGGGPGRRHPHRGPAPLRDRVPELLPVRRRLRDGLGALRGHPRLLGAPVPPAARPHGVLSGGPRPPARRPLRAWPSRWPCSRWPSSGSRPSRGWS